MTLLAWIRYVTSCVSNVTIQEKSLTAVMFAQCHSLAVISCKAVQAQWNVATLAYVIGSFFNFPGSASNASSSTLVLYGKMIPNGIHSLERFWMPSNPFCFFFSCSNFTSSQVNQALRNFYKVDNKRNLFVICFTKNHVRIENCSEK